MHLASRAAGWRHHGAVQLVVCLLFAVSWALTPEEKDGMLCADPCDAVLINKIKELDPTYTVLVESNQDTGPDLNAPLTDLSIRAPCVDLRRVSEVVTSSFNTFNLSANNLVLSGDESTPLPPAQFLRVQANGLSSSKNSRLDLPRLSFYNLYGYSSIFRSTASPRLRRDNTPYGGLDVSLDRADPLAITTSVYGVKLDSVWPAYNERPIAGTSPEEMLQKSRLCTEDVFMAPDYSKDYELPLYCLYKVPDSNPWSFKMYFFNWAVFPSATYRVTEYDRAPIGPEGFRVWVSDEDPSSTKNRLRMLNFKGTTASPDAITFARGYFNMRDAIVRRGGSLYDRLLVAWKELAGVKFYASSPLVEPGNGIVARTALKKPDSGLGTLLITCWTYTWQFPPYDTYFVPSLITMVNALSQPGGDLIDDTLLANAVKLYSNLNTSRESGQRAVTELSYDTYTLSLQQYAAIYIDMQRQVRAALDRTATAEQRHNAGQVVLESARAAERNAQVVYFQYRDRVRDLGLAYNHSQALIDDAQKTLNSSLAALEQGLRDFKINKGISSGLGFLKAIFQMGEGIAKANVEGIFKALGGFVTAIEEEEKLRALLASIDKLNALVDSFKGVGDTAVDVLDSRLIAQYVYSKVQIAVEKGSPALFTDADRRLLASGIFEQDLSTSNTAIFNFTSLRDNAGDLLAPAIEKGVGGARNYTIALRGFASAGTNKLKLHVEWNDALSQAIVAGVQYLNALQSRKVAEAALKGGRSDPLRIRDMNYHLVLQAVATKTQTLTLLNRACNAFFYAFVKDCGIPVAVLNGQDEDSLLQTIALLLENFAKVDDKPPETVKVAIPFGFDGLSKEIEGLRWNRTLQFVIEPENFFFRRYYAVGIDLIMLTINGIKVPPPYQGRETQVQVIITTDGYSQVKDVEHKVYKFRGPPVQRDIVYEPVTGRVTTSGEIYPGVAFRYYKPSPFNSWQFVVVPEPTNNPLGLVDTSEVTSAVVTFVGAGRLYGAPACGANNPVFFSTKNCSCLGLTHAMKKQCRKASKKLLTAQRDLCEVDPSLCFITTSANRLTVEL